MLASRDQQWTHLARATQLGKHRRELDALGASSDNEGKGEHLKSRKGGAEERAQGPEKRLEA